MLFLKLQTLRQYSDSSILHCASLLRTISASLAHERVHVHNERNLPQGKRDSEINVPFPLNERGHLHFCRTIIVYILSSLIQKKFKKFYRTEKKI